MQMSTRDFCSNEVNEVGSTTVCTLPNDGTLHALNNVAGFSSYKRLYTNRCFQRALDFDGTTVAQHLLLQRHCFPMADILGNNPTDLNKEEHARWLDEYVSLQLCVVTIYGNQNGKVKIKRI